MSGWKLGVGAFVLVVGFGFPAKAQGIVPGGWAPQFGYQTFGMPGVRGFSFGSATPGDGAGGSGMAEFGMGVTPSGFGGFNPYGQGLYQANPYGVNYGFNASSGRAVNAMDPLIDSIRQTTQRRWGR
jgi:hypothetical protein